MKTVFLQNIYLRSYLYFEAIFFNTEETQRLFFPMFYIKIKNFKVVFMILGC